MGADVLFIVSLFLVPFTSVLVRYRASYHPLSAAPSQAASEASSATASASESVSTSATGEPVVAPAAPSFLGVGKRIRRIEGWAGLYKGFLPTLLSNLLLLLVPSRSFLFPIPSTSYESLQSALFHNLLYVPGLIFVYRAIVTTHNLEISGTSMRTAMEALFTDHERKKPWVLWLTPGLLPAILLNILLRILALRPLRQIVEPDRRNWPIHYNEIFYLRVGATILLLAFFTAVLAPLDVIVTRLAIQRNNGNLETEPASEALGIEVVDIEKAEVGPQPESEELAFRLRPDKDLYQGLYDCTTRIVREEGWQVLYRGWWIVLLSTVFCY